MVPTRVWASQPELLSQVKKIDITKTRGPVTNRDQHFSWQSKRNPVHGAAVGDGVVVVHLLHQFEASRNNLSPGQAHAIRSISINVSMRAYLLVSFFPYRPRWHHSWGRAGSCSRGSNLAEAVLKRDHRSHMGVKRKWVWKSWCQAKKPFLWYPHSRNGFNVDSWKAFWSVFPEMETCHLKWDSLINDFFERGQLQHQHRTRGLCTGMRSQEDQIADLRCNARWNLLQIEW